MAVTDLGEAIQIRLLNGFRTLNTYASTMYTTLKNRLAPAFSAVSTALTPYGSGKSVTGKSLPTKYLEASEVASHSCDFKETTESGGGSGTVYANWYDKNSGEYFLEKVGDGDTETELQEIFSTKEQAIAAAKAKFKRTTKSNVTFRFSIAGRTDLFAESPLVLKGFPSKIPTKWIINRVEHSLSPSGFTTAVDCCGGN